MTTNRNPPRRPAQQETATQSAPPRQDIPEAGAGNQAPAVQDQQQAGETGGKRSLAQAIAARGIDEFQWRTLQTSLFPGAANESILMAVDYCRARRLDVLKKPCHIVNMEVRVRNKQTGRDDKVYRDVILPGIYEYRTTAMRTGLYLGHDEPECGDWEDQFGTNAPLWCKFVVYRWNEKAQQKVAFPVIVYFEEVVALYNGQANFRWAKAPYQMLVKCAEAAALRAAFPDELGGEPTFEEIDGRYIPETAPAIDPPATRLDAATEALKGATPKPAASPPPQTVHQPSQHSEWDEEPPLDPRPQAEAPKPAASPPPATEQAPPEEKKTGTSGPGGEVGSYSEASALQAIKQARTPKALNAIWDLILDDFAITDREMPDSLTEAYKGRARELAKT